jgi:hypothetical protein
MKKEAWYKAVLKKNGKELLAGAAFSLTFSLALLLWSFILHHTFVWQTIAPLSAPPLVYGIYSALVFVTFGAFLYWIKFYKFLYFVFVEVLGDWRSYKQIKAIIWLGLICLTYYIVTQIINAINFTLSIFLNVANFLLYLSPPLGVALIVAAVVYVLRFRSQPTLEALNAPSSSAVDIDPGKGKVKSFLEASDETLLLHTNVAADTPNSNLAKAVLQHRLNNNIVELKQSTEFYSKALIVFSLFVIIIATEQLLITIFPPRGIFIWIYVFVGLDVFALAMGLTNKMLDRE